MQESRGQRGEFRRRHLRTHTASDQPAVHSGGTQLCLDAYDNQTAPGTKAIIWTCNGRPNQQWKLGRAPTADRPPPGTTPGGGRR
ncbi:RICIN domain-containing protein [Kitasatospora sp. NPDC088134]|uniref:RICIN domain-containing protein n=1 Tax=Kitasatospora sp. NPDC088134 TaxID=3364071 RepID=UPI0037F3753D